MFSLDPRKQTEQMIIVVMGFWICAYVLRSAYEVIRPALPFLIVVGVIAGVIRLTLAWRRRY
jgi:hypothetical protein